MNALNVFEYLWPQLTEWRIMLDYKLQCNLDCRLDWSRPRSSLSFDRSLAFCSSPSSSIAFLFFTSVLLCFWNETQPPPAECRSLVGKSYAASRDKEMRNRCEPIESCEILAVPLTSFVSIRSLNWNKPIFQAISYICSAWSRLSPRGASLRYFVPSISNSL